MKSTTWPYNILADKIFFVNLQAITNWRPTIAVSKRLINTY